MKFRTEYLPSPQPLRLSPSQPVTLLGSCFTTNIGSRMRSCMWDALHNPCGPLFNPLSISGVIRLALDKSPCIDIHEDASGILRPWDFSTLFAGTAADDVRRRCHDALASLRSHLLRSDALILTFGTSLVYELAESPGRVVANCHKAPQSLFTSRRAGIGEMARSVADAVGRVRELNPGIKLIVTVSPVRHLAQGLHHNSLLKAELMLACEKILEMTGNASYFPAYEIVCDDLRDYRFYDSDMTHPSQQAADYVFEKFAGAYLDSDARRLLAEAAALRRRLDHRPLHPATPEAVAFEEATARMVADFTAAYPGMRP